MKICQTLSRNSQASSSPYRLPKATGDKGKPTEFRWYSSTPARWTSAPLRIVVIQVVQSPSVIQIPDVPVPVLSGRPLMRPLLTHVASPASAPVSDDFLRARISEWNRDTEFVSSLTEVIGHPAFRRIVEVGHDAVPFLLRQVKKEPSFLVLALREITGENPVPSSAKGKVKEMAEAWLAWGEKKGLLR